jgi:hypothetical protein
VATPLLESIVAIVGSEDDHKTIRVSSVVGGELKLPVTVKGEVPVGAAASAWFGSTVRLSRVLLGAGELLLPQAVNSRHRTSTFPRCFILSPQEDDCRRTRVAGHNWKLYTPFSRVNCQPVGIQGCTEGWETNLEVAEPVAWD